MSTNVNFGCGHHSPQGWLNFDCSPRLRLERLPLVGRLCPPGPFGRFPTNVRYGDIVRGLPLKPGSVALLYSSHVLEHLSLADFRIAVRHGFELLRPGGVFRSVMPDLESLVHHYGGDADPGASKRFIDYSGMGKEHRPRGFVGFLQAWLGNAHHLWLWDFKGVAQELAEAGFRNVRRAEFGDSAFPEFHQVESSDRWKNALGFECIKPETAA